MKALIILSVLACIFYSSEKRVIAVENDRTAIILPCVMPNTIDDHIAYFSEKYSIPKAVIIGVGISETGFGVDGVGVAPINNLFGIQAGHTWKGQVYQKCDSCFKWKQYPSRFESIEDFCQFIHFHYAYLIGRKVKDWRIYGYGNSKYEQIGFFNQFETE